VNREGGWVFTFPAATYSLVRMRNLLSSTVGDAVKEPLREVRCWL